MAKSSASKDHLDSNRVQFNWGYHGGALAARHAWSKQWKAGKHFSPVYEKGYDIGYRDQQDGKYIDGQTLSDDAWEKALKDGEVKW